MDSSQQPTNAFEDMTPSSPEAPMEAETPDFEPEAEQAQPPEPDSTSESTASTELEIESETPDFEPEVPQPEAEQAQPPEPDSTSETTASEARGSSPSPAPVPSPEPPVFDDSDLDSPWDKPDSTVMPPQQPAVQSENLPFTESQVPAKSMNFGLLINRIVAIAIFIYGAIAVISLLN